MDLGLNEQQELLKNAAREFLEHEFPLAEAAKAQRALEHRETIGKILLIP